MPAYRVYYVRSDNFRDFIFGDKLPDITNLNDTHAHLRDLNADSLEDVFRIQQAHNWASDYAACNALLAERGLGHTSMSVGDLVQDIASGEIWHCARIGFTSLGTLPAKSPARPTWAIIENAGYVGENVRLTGLASYARADAVMRRLYRDADEREKLHVDIAREDPDGFSYDY